MSTGVGIAVKDGKTMPGPDNRGKETKKSEGGKGAAMASTSSRDSRMDWWSNKSEGQGYVRRWWGWETGVVSSVRYESVPWRAYAYRSMRARNPDGQRSSKKAL